MTADWYVLSPNSNISFRVVHGLRLDENRFAFPPEVLRRISSRITNEVAGINRVTYDISSKPPAVSAICFLMKHCADKCVLLIRQLSGCRHIRLYSST